MPATASKAPNKLIYDRVDRSRAGREARVARRKAGRDKDRVRHCGDAGGASAARRRHAAQPALGSGVIASEPKKVHTIAIRPDQPAWVANRPSSRAAPPPHRCRRSRARQPLPRRRAPPAAAAAATSRRHSANRRRAPAEARAAAPVRHTRRRLPQCAAVAEPDAPRAAAPQRGLPCAPRRWPRRRASRRRPPRRSAAATPCRFRRSAAKPKRRPRSAACKPNTPTSSAAGRRLIHKVDLGAKGTYYRAMVGPFANANEASAAVQRPQGGRRAVPCPAELARLCLNLRGRGLIRADGGARIHHRIERAHDLRQ